METYWIACQKCEYGVPYNIGGESIISVGDFLEQLKKQANVPIRSMVDKKLLRPVDVTLQVPDVSKFINATGWKPRYSLEDSVDFLLNHYRGIK
jgi:nucleoside-diphosphate-sugar epimerase